MQKIIASLKLLCVPLLIGLVNTALQTLQAVRQTGRALDWHGVELDLARQAFVWQAAVALLLTFGIGAPYFRWCLRRQREGYGVWLSGWLLVHALQLVFTFIAALHSQQWLPLASLLLSIVVVSGVWWALFYAGE